MDKSEREETTDYANKKINSFLSNHEYVSALLLASIYLNIRLKSLLTERLSPPEGKWKETSQSLDSLWGYAKMVGICDKLGLIPNKRQTLKNIWKKRNSIAHESKLWKELSDNEKKEITNLCLSAIEFLEATNS